MSSLHTRNILKRKKKRVPIKRKAETKSMLKGKIQNLKGILHIHQINNSYFSIERSCVLFHDKYPRVNTSL